LNWIKDLFGCSKPIIAMCHMRALPGDPGYDSQKGLGWIVDQAHNDLRALQEGGVDTVMFSNESSLPYLTRVEPITTACMGRVIGQLLGEVKEPFGVNVLWDPIASIDLAVATGASFVREIFTGVYASDFGIWNTNCGAVVRHQHRVHGGHIKLFFNILPEASVYLGDRSLADIARSTVFNTKPDALCVSGLTAGVETSAESLRVVKAAVPEVPVFANTGVKLENLERILEIADGVVIGTAFKRDGYIWNEVDQKRVAAFMQRAKELRGG